MRPRMLWLVVMRRRSWMCVVALAGVAACRQPNPDWLGPAGEATVGSEDDGTASTDDETTATASTSTPVDTSDPTTGTSTDDVPLPSQCAPDTIAGSGECPSTCSACDGGRCIVDCTAIDCSNQTVVCPEGWPCDFLCSGEAVCRRGQLECARDRECTVDCQGVQACQRTTVICGAGTCAVKCGADENACRLLDVACGLAGATVTCEAAHDVDLHPADGSECACEDFGCEG